MISSILEPLNLAAEKIDVIMMCGDGVTSKINGTLPLSNNSHHPLEQKDAQRNMDQNFLFQR